MKKLLLPLLLGLIMLGAGCEKNGIEPEKGKADAFKGRFLTMEVPQTAGIGEPVKIKVDITPSVSAPPYELEWDIDPKLADFDKTTNTLTRKANGPVTVKVNVKGYPDIWASRTINPIIATKISFKKRTHNVEVGQSVTVDVEVTPKGADTDFEWKLNNSNASFDEKTRTLTLNNPNAAQLTVSMKGKPELTDVCLIKHPNTIYFFDEYLRYSILNDSDFNHDGIIQQSEAESVTRVWIRNRECKSFQGIEFLPNLEEIDCKYNDINDIDISKNPKLTILRCSGNNLSSIDLSRNPNLTILECDENNLSIIDTQRNPKLEIINCANNQISLLKLNNNKNLTNLNISKNKISTIDLSNNVRIQSLICSENKLSSLNFSIFPELQELECSNNNLSNIDITKNTKLKVIYCSYNQLSSIDITNNIDLTDLFCDFNKISSIDASKCDNIKVIYCDYNNICSINTSNCIKLERLICRHNSIANLNLTTNINLNHLNLFMNKVSTIDISKCINLTSIDINDNNLTSIDISKNKKLNIVNLQQNPNLYKIFVWKGFTPGNMFYKDDKATYLEVSE